MHYWFLSPDWPPKRAHQGGCTSHRPHRNLTKKGSWGGKETLKHQQTVSPQTVESSQPDGVANVPQP